MISLTKVSKQFDSVSAVKHVTLTIPAGEIVGFLGPNGAGKTTTMRIMAGVLPPSSGTVQIDGLGYEGNEHSIKSRIGYLPENNPLYDELTVEEHLHFWAKLKGITDSDLKKAIDFGVESTGIADVYYRFIGELSKGYRQRVGLAQAILSQPDILLLDEPTEGLDPNQRNDIQTLLSSLKKDRTVVISSHVLSEISKLAHRVVIIHQGSVVSDDTPSNLMKGEVGNRQLEVELLGTKVVSTLKKHARILDVEKQAPRVYRITYDGSTDIREELFDLVVKQEWKLLALAQVDRKLEDVFAELTRETA